MNFEIDDVIINSDLELFSIVKKHEPFDDLVEVNEPLLLVYDNNIDKERYILYKEYVELKYDYIKNINIIEKGFF